MDEMNEDQRTKEIQTNGDQRTEEKIVESNENRKAEENNVINGDQKTEEIIAENSEGRTTEQIIKENQLNKPQRQSEPGGQLNANPNGSKVEKNRPKRMGMALCIVLTALITFGGTFGFANTHFSRLIEEAINNSDESNPIQNVTKQVVLSQEDAQIEAIDTVAEAIVGVVNYHQNQALSQGSGIIYKVENGDTYLVTNEHVVANGDAFEVVFDNEDNDRLEAEIVGTDVFTDLAVLRIRDYEANTVAQFGNTEELKIGQTVIAIGNPLGLGFAGSATSGIVSGHDRTINIRLNNINQDEWEMTVLQTDAAINRGNSGGALINLAGEVVGINSMKISSSEVEGMSFSIPTYVALPIIKDLETFEKVLRPTLGVSISNLSQIPERYKELLSIPIDRKDGVYIDEVVEGSLADDMGIKANDVVTALNGVEIENTLSFRKELFNYREGDEITITVLREGESINLSAEVVMPSQE